VTCPDSSTNGVAYCTRYDYSGGRVIACTNAASCPELSSLNYDNFVCCNVDLCNNVTGLAPYTPPAPGTPSPDSSPSPDGSSPTPDPAGAPGDLGADGVLQCYVYFGSSDANDTIVNCTGTTGVPSRCASYSTLTNPDDPNSGLVTTGVCATVPNCYDWSILSANYPDLVCCDDDLCNGNSSSGLPGWAIAIIVIFVLLAVVLIVIALFVILKGKDVEKA